jgi:outer membrane protein assembly factor BamB
LVDDNPDSVVPRDDEFLDGLRYRLHGALARLPAAAKQRYRAKFDNPARQLFDQAASAGSSAQMRQVYSRFRHSSYGSRALAWIAERALDTGNPETARVAYGRLLAEGSSSPGALLKYALASQAVGRTGEARTTLERIIKEAPNAVVKVGGQQVAARAAAQQVLDHLGGASFPAPVWPGFGGPNGDRRMPAEGGLAAGWRKIWEYGYPQPPVATGVPGQRAQIIMSGYGSPSNRNPFITFPVVDHDRVYVQGTRSITALNLADGKPFWVNEEFGSPSVETPAPSRPFRGGYYRQPGRQPQGVPALDGGLLAVRMPLTSGNTYRNDFLLCVIDARSGRQLWRKIAEGDPEGSYFNVPTMRDNTIFTGIATGLAGITEFRAVAMEAGSGDALWSSYLGGGSDSVNGIDGSPPVLRDGLVWIESSLHTLNALDMITGEIRWVYKYMPRSRNVFGSPGELANEPVSLLPSTGPMVFSSRWGSDVVGIDATNGRLLWSAPKNSASTLFAVDRQNAYLCRSDIAAFDLENGMKKWVRGSPGAQSSAGYAAMIGDRLCWLVEGKIYVLDPATGNVTSTIDMAESLAQSPGVTTLLAAGKRLLICTRDKMFAFEPTG